MEAPPAGSAAQEAEDEPLLLAELKPGRPQQYDWKASCETWSVAFSPDGTWFAWSQGHCIVKLIPWPLEEAELSCKASERKNRGIKADVRGGGGAKEKTLECGQIVWGLAFSPWPPPGAKEPAPGRPCLILATGLNDGQIKVWEVQTGRLLFSLSGHLDVVRDLSFAPNGSLILVSASRDKTLRIWDLSRDGASKQVQVLSGHTQWVYCCSISPDCSMLCSAAGEKSAFLWSMRSYTLIRKLEGHQSSVVSCDFSPDSALLVTASYDTCVIMWDPYTGEQLRTLRDTCELCSSTSHDDSRKAGALIYHVSPRVSRTGQGSITAQTDVTPADLGFGTKNSSGICTYDQWPVLRLFPTWWIYCHRDERWPRPVLECPQGPLIT